MALSTRRMTSNDYLAMLESSQSDALRYSSAISESGDIRGRDKVIYLMQYSLGRGLVWGIAALVRAVQEKDVGR